MDGALVFYVCRRLVPSMLRQVQQPKLMERRKQRMALAPFSSLFKKRKRRFAAPLSIAWVCLLLFYYFVVVGGVSDTKRTEHPK